MTLARLRWGAAIGLTVIGLAWMVQVPVIQDDLVDLAQGLGGLHTGGVWAHVRDQLPAAVSAKHVVPVAVVVGTAHQVVVTGLIGLGVDPTVAWSVMRIAWVVLALLCATFFITAWSGEPPQSRSEGVAMRTRTYAGVAAVLVATLQVHALWSNDPTVSYPVAGWAGCCVGLVFLGLVARVVMGRIRPEVGAAVIAGVGLLCVFLYAMVVAFVIAGLLGVLLTRRVHRMTRLWVVAGIGLPLVLFALAQAWRVSLPNDYTGTLPGEPGRVLPTAAWGLASALPLTALAPLRRMVEIQWPVGQAGEPLAAVFVMLTVGAVVGLSLIWLSAPPVGARVAPTPERAARGERSTGGNEPILPPVAVVAVLFWVGCTAIIALSARYQKDLSYLGAVHTFYAAGAIAVAILVVRGVTATRAGVQRRGLVPGLILALAGLALATVTLNTLSADRLNRDQAVAREVLTAYARDLPDQRHQRCVAMTRLLNSVYPQYYRTDVLTGLAMSFLAVHGRPMCPARDMNGGYSHVLRVAGATHGLEFDDRGRAFQWLRPGTAVVTFEPAMTIPPWAQPALPDSLSLAFSVPPCMNEQRLRLVTQAGKQLPEVMVLASRPAFVALSPVDAITVESLRGGCQVAGDSREFAAQVSFAPASERRKSATAPALDPRDVTTENR